MTYEYEGKTEREAIELAANELGLERDQFDVEILETQKNSLFKKGYVRIRVHTLDDVKVNHASYEDRDMNEGHSRIVADPLPQGEFEEKLIEFVTNVIEKMGYDVRFRFLTAKTKSLELSLIHLILQF